VREWKKKSKILDDCDKPGFADNLAANRSGRAGLKERADVVVEEDHRRGTVPQEGDVTDTAFRRRTVKHC
jgi:hypothetical protein